MSPRPQAPPEQHSLRGSASGGAPSPAPTSPHNRGLCCPHACCSCCLSYCTCQPPLSPEPGPRPLAGAVTSPPTPLGLPETPSLAFPGLHGSLRHPLSGFQPSAPADPTPTLGAVHGAAPPGAPDGGRVSQVDSEAAKPGLPGSLLSPHGRRGLWPVVSANVLNDSWVTDISKAR